jgi:hypothetical protein
LTSPAPKGTRARQFLDYCRHAAILLRENPTGSEWVIKWAATLALLRAVGDALEKVDAKESKSFKYAQSQWWNEIKQNKPNHAIFWRFIREDRNLLLHEAELTAGQSAMVVLTGVSVHALTGNQQPPTQEPLPSPQATYSYHMNRGAFHGHDPRDLVDQAIKWWDDQITSIENAAI